MHYYIYGMGDYGWDKEINAIIAMQAPVNIKQVLSFIGAVTYYRNIWP